MRALFRTLFGNVHTVGAVAAMVLDGGVLARAGHPGCAAVLMPLTALAGIAWLVRH